MNPKAPLLSRPNFIDPALKEQIRQRAYVLCLGRGQANGSAVDDWLKAEEEVLGLKEAKAASTSS
jgi:hypothetical protein